MKFDVVIGNPPYQVQAGDDDVTSVSTKFAKKIFTLVNEHGWVALVNANAGLGAGQSTIVDLLEKRDVKFMSPSSLGKKYFPDIAKGISVYIVKNSEGTGTFTLQAETDLIQTRFDEFQYHNKNKKDAYIPRSVSNLTDFNLLKKIVNTGEAVFQFRGGMHGGKVDKRVRVGFKTSRKVTASPNAFRFFDNEFDNEFDVRHPCGIDYAITENMAKSVFCSYVFHWVIEKICGESFDTPANLSYFPEIKIDKVYTHDDLAKLFELTKEESDHIILWANTKSTNYWTNYHSAFI